MLDIGMAELMLIAVVGLIVIGPARLPETLRTLGLWFGRLQRSFLSVKNEIEKEIGMDDIKRQLHNEAVMEEMKRIEEQVKSSTHVEPLPSDVNAKEISEDPFSNSIHPPEITPDQNLNEAEVIAETTDAHEQEAGEPAPDRDTHIEAQSNIEAEPALDPLEEKAQELIDKPAPLPPTDADLEAAYERKLKRANKQD